MKTNQKGISHLLVPLLIILVAAIAGTFYMVSSKADQVTRPSSSATTRATQQALVQRQQGINNAGFVESQTDSTNTVASLTNPNVASTASNKPKIVWWNYDSYLANMRKQKDGMRCGSEFYVFSAVTSGNVNKVTVKIGSGGITTPRPNGDFLSNSRTISLTYRGDNLWGYNKTLSGPTNATSYWFEDVACGYPGTKITRHSFVMTAYGQNGKKTSYKGTFKPSKLRIK